MARAQINPAATTRIRLFVEVRSMVFPLWPADRRGSVADLVARYSVATVEY